MSAIKGIVLCCVIGSLGELWASQPGQPLDCTDWVLSEPGLYCEEIELPDLGSPGILLWDRSSNLVTDNLGRALIIEGGGSPEWSLQSWFNPQHRITVKAKSFDADPSAVIAQIIDRPGLGGRLDHIRPVRPHATTSINDVSRWTLGHTLIFDAVDGRLLIPSEVYCGDVDSGCPDYPPKRKIFAIRGFTTLYEITQTYAPTSSSLHFRVPAIPNGFPVADLLDSYWGPLSQPFSFSSAQPLQCGYPVQTPQPGDYLSVVDTVPTPPLGEGIYFVTAVVSQGRRRFGRRYTNGAFSGRDSNELPACQ